jgi:hypothetical protein
MSAPTGTRTLRPARAGRPTPTRTAYAAVAPPCCAAVPPRGLSVATRRRSARCPSTGVRQPHRLAASRADEMAAEAQELMELKHWSIPRPASATPARDPPHRQVLRRATAATPSDARASSRGSAAHISRAATCSQRAGEWKALGAMVCGWDWRRPPNSASAHRSREHTAASLTGVSSVSSPRKHCDGTAAHSARRWGAEWSPSGAWGARRSGAARAGFSARGTSCVSYTHALPLGGCRRSRRVARTTQGWRRKSRQQPPWRWRRR